ncbi:MAG: hypothetical protein HN368_22980, partial [Spirochaetales bacterium]|nr:hypothetical protein [Spirochaetales bacterium]
WKGPIGEFFFLKPNDWEGDLSDMAPMLRHPAFQIYAAFDYEPDRDRQFSLSATSGDYEEISGYMNDIFPSLKKMWTSKSQMRAVLSRVAQNFVADPEASTALSDKIRVFTSTGVIEKAGFGADAAFDGIPETSWSENVPGTGAGEYLEVSLSEPVWGLEIRNGFKRFTADDWVFGFYRFDRDIKDDSAGLKDYHTMNSRVKILSITDTRGTALYDLALSDRRDVQTFTGIFLPAGRYRFVIKDTYEGTRWQDTCLAEITFLDLASKPEVSMFWNDPFYSIAISGQRFTKLTLD